MAESILAVNHSLTQQRLSDLTECPLCLQKFRQPKCLPCIHTFCLGCLELYVRKRENHVPVCCPICREIFEIPEDGLDGLRDNFIINSLSELNLSQATKRISCDTCARDNEGEEDECVNGSKVRSSVSVAVNCCENCDKNFCESCSKSHRQIFKSHKLTAVKGNEDHCINIQRYCPVHTKEPLRLYCVECKVSVCIICLVSEHNGHKAEEISTAASRFRDLIDTKAVKLDEASIQTATSIMKLQKLSDDVEERAISVTNDIRKRCAELKKMIDAYESDLLNEVAKFEADCLNEHQKILDPMLCQYVLLKSVKDHLEEIKVKKSDFEVTDSAGEFLSTAQQHLMSTKELQQNFEKGEFNIPEFSINGNILPKSFIGTFKQFDKEKESNIAEKADAAGNICQSKAVVVPSLKQNSIMVDALEPLAIGGTQFEPLACQSRRVPSGGETDIKLGCGSQLVFTSVPQVIHMWDAPVPSYTFPPSPAGFRYPPVVGTGTRSIYARPSTPLQRAPIYMYNAAILGLNQPSVPIRHSWSAGSPGSTHNCVLQSDIQTPFTATCSSKDLLPRETDASSTTPQLMALAPSSSLTDQSLPNGSSASSQPEGSVAQSLSIQLSTEEQQWRDLGERLYPLVYAINPVRAKKITGMLLEMDRTELIGLFDSRESLKDKVEEAATVLEEYLTNEGSTRNAI